MQKNGNLSVTVMPAKLESVFPCIISPFVFLQTYLNSTKTLNYQTCHVTEVLFKYVFKMYKHCKNIDFNLMTQNQSHPCHQSIVYANVNSSYIQF